MESYSKVKQKTEDGSSYISQPNRLW